MYYLIRVGLFLVVFFLCALHIGKTKLRGNRKAYIWCAVICFALASVSCYLPVENAWCTFESAEEVFSYTNGREIAYTLEGDSSCMVVYQSAPGTSSFVFVGKEGDGYQILPQYCEEVISRKTDENGIIIVYRVKNTNDCYIQATLGREGNIQVFDETGKTESIVKTIANSGMYDIYVKDLSESAYLTIDGVSINIYG